MQLTPKQLAHLVRMARVYVQEAKYGDPRDFDPETVAFAEALKESTK